MIDPAALDAAVGQVEGVRMVLPGTLVLAGPPAEVVLRLVVRRSATSGTVARAAAERVREVLGTAAVVRVEVAVVE